MRFYELIRIAWDFEFDYVQTKMKYFLTFNHLLSVDDATRYLILY